MVRKILGACILAGAVATLTMQRNAISTLRAANQELAQKKEEAEKRSRPALQTAAADLSSQEVTALREANKELPKMRNEVRQLREQKRELDRLRAENTRLTVAIQAVPTRPMRLADMEGYVSKDKWTHVGFATPEGTLQSFFSAIRRGDVRAMAECMSPRARANFEREFEGKSEQERQKALEAGMGQIAKVGGYQIAETNQISADRIVLGVRVAAGGELLKLPLARFGNEWKLDEEEK
ncbi:MAG: hypothetical protein L0Y58_09805 [Verrucomicrobia subdivision 3 bacterium]|nr:hypothetical protein [Limisphaerales bacterium]